MNILMIIDYCKFLLLTLTVEREIISLQISNFFKFGIMEKFSPFELLTVGIVHT